MIKQMHDYYGMEEERLKTNFVHLSKIVRQLCNVSLTEVRLNEMKS